MGTPGLSQLFSFQNGHSEKGLPVLRGDSVQNKLNYFTTWPSTFSMLLDKLPSTITYKKNYLTASDSNFRNILEEERVKLMVSFIEFWEDSPCQSLD